VKLPYHLASHNRKINAPSLQSPLTTFQGQNSAAGHSCPS
jgi:hypothetical protein